MNPSNAHSSLRGATYTLLDGGGSSEGYFRDVREAADLLLRTNPDQRVLRDRIRTLSKRPLVLVGHSRQGRALLSESGPAGALHRYTEEAGPFLRSLQLADRLDGTLRTRRWQYHLNMLEIELTNRINRDAFRSRVFKMALVAHCLRDYREECRSEPGSIEAVCRHCSEDCFIHLGAEVMDAFGISAFISVRMDHDRLFAELKGKYPDMGVLGVACIPELVQGLRLCDRKGIPAVGVPLDVNRCGRWCPETGETSFNLKELSRLVS